MNVNHDSRTVINPVISLQQTVNECRVCLKKCNDVWQIFHPTNLEISRKLMAFAAVQVEEGDGLPATICHDCRRLLDVAYDFKLQVEKSDAKLREIFMLKDASEETEKMLSLSVNATINEAIVEEMAQEHCNNIVRCTELDSMSDDNNPIVTELNHHHYVAHHEPIIFRIEPPTHDRCVIEHSMTSIESEICEDSSGKGIVMNCTENRVVDVLINKYEDLGETDITASFKSEAMLTSESEISNDENMIKNVANTEIEKSAKNTNNENIEIDFEKVESTNMQDEFANVENEIMQDDFTNVENEIIRDGFDKAANENIENNFEKVENENIQDGFSSMENEKQTTIEDENCVDEISNEELYKREEEKPLSSRTQRLKCPHCIKTFGTKTSLGRHLEMHANKAKLRYVCYMCDKQFSNIAKLKNHVSHGHGHVENDEKTVNIVDEASRGDRQLSRTDVKRNTKFICKICGKQFTYQKSFLTHAKTHPNYEPETIFEKEENVTGSEETNERDGHETEDDDDDMPIEGLQCTQCGKLFATKRNLKRHISTHSGLKFHCSSCSKEFSRIDKLKEHEQSKHKDEFFASSDSDSDDDTDNENNKNNDGNESRKKEKHNRPHKCPMCPKAFAQEQSLANHMERHKRVKDTQKRFLCEVCSKCFAQSGSLVAHMRTHTGVKPYVCNVCSRAFTKSTYLQLHLRTHSGEKPYICQYCSRAFARANTLARHITMHTGEAKYHCQICMKSFRRLTSLNEHTYTHTGQRPYACKICTKRYNNAGSLYAHTKKCKAQQSSGDTTAYALPIDDVIHEDNNAPPMMIYSQRKLSEDSSTELQPSSQFMISNVHNPSLKNLPNNVVPQFTVDDPNFCNLNAKSYKNSYYTLYPNM